MSGLNKYYFFEDLISLTQSENKTELEQSILTAIYWIGEAQQEYHIHSAFIKYWSALEALVYGTFTDITQEIIKQISVSLIMGGYHFIEIEKFEKTCFKIKILYEKRSKIVHTGQYNNVTHEDLATIRQYAVWMVLGHLGLRSQNYQQFQQIKQQTDRLFNLMSKNDPLPCLASCGIDCAHCVNYKEGFIKNSSTKLYNFLKTCKSPWLNDDKPFIETLDKFSKANCGGCRSKDCDSSVNCTLRTCQKENKIIYCFRCKLYPCEKEHFQEPLQTFWKKSNLRMKEIGEIEFYNEQSKLPGN